jgi:hypothetical protein
MDECDAPAGRLHARLSLWQVVFRMLILVPVGQPSIRRPCQRTLDIEQPGQDPRVGVGASLQRTKCLHDVVSGDEHAADRRYLKGKPRCCPAAGFHAMLISPRRPTITRVLSDPFDPTHSPGRQPAPRPAASIRRGAGRSGRRHAAVQPLRHASAGDHQRHPASPLPWRHDTPGHSWQPDPARRETSWCFQALLIPPSRCSTITAVWRNIRRRLAPGAFPHLGHVQIPSPESSLHS